jgi:hypothetical protein
MTCGHPTPMHIQDSDGERFCTINTTEGCECKADPREPVLPKANNAMLDGFAEKLMRFAATPACEHCPHAPHNGLCGKGINSDGRTFCACRGENPPPFWRGRT